MSYDDIHYANPILREFICRIDFTTAVNWTEKQILKAIADKSKDIGYGTVNIVQKHEDSFQITQKTGKVIRQQNTFNEYHFLNDAGNEFIVNNSCIIHRLTSYDIYEKHYDEFTSFIDSIILANSNLMFKRIGMRYINVIDNVVNYSELPSYIRKQFIPVLPKCSFNFTPAKLMNLVEMKTPEEYFLRINYGVYNPDHPSSIRKYDFLLDIDCYLSSVIDPNDASSIISTFHDYIQDVFEKTITQELRDKMNES